MHVGVSRVFGNEDMNRTSTLARRSPSTLDCSHGARDGFVQHHEVRCRYVQPFFTDRCGHQHVDLTAPKTVELGELLFLRHAFLTSP